MTTDDLLALAPPSLRPALERRGFTELTMVQRAVVESAESGRDLRVTSQTGSGKTVAYGMAVLMNAIDAPETRPSKRKVSEAASRSRQPTRPVRVVVLVPTRELAQQVATELTWLYQDVGLRVTAVFGGTSVRNDIRVLQEATDILVATPGRLCDHVRTGGVDLSRVKALVLDEADEMLAMGFREELDQIVEALPESRRTVLVSATFPRAVSDLVARIQRDPVFVRGTEANTSHGDIEHIIHLVSTGDREAAVVNVLLMDPEITTLLFTKTRDGANELATRLGRAGFSVELLSGEMDQRARTRALESFREGRVKLLVATDVAARGLDVQDIGRVIHVDPPDDPDSYTHRSGRTGRAGRKGESVVLIPPGKRPRIAAMLDRARAPYVIRPVPTAAEVDAAQRKRLVAVLTASAVPEGQEERIDVDLEALFEGNDPKLLVQRLFSRLHAKERITAPRNVQAIVPPARGSRPRPMGDPLREEDGYSIFHVTFGTKNGATKQRMLALVCRRGDIESRDVGAIRLGVGSSTVEVRNSAAVRFAERAKEPDERDPRVKIEAWSANGARDAERAEGAEAPRREYPRNDGPPRGDRPRFDGPRGDRPPPRGDRPAPWGDRPRYDGPRNDGPPRDRPRYDGPRNDGPRYDAPRNDGPRSDGPRYDGPRTDAPRTDGPPRDRPRYDGPRNDGPPRDRPRYDGPRNAGPRYDGPRNDGPPRGDRPAPGPRTDGPGAAGPHKTPYKPNKPYRPKKG